MAAPLGATPSLEEFDRFWTLTQALGEVQKQGDPARGVWRGESGRRREGAGRRGFRAAGHF